MSRPPLPVVLCSSVVRGAQPGEAHGELWVVDLELDEARCVWEQRDTDIDFSGHGGDRGLRGLCVVGDRVFVATSHHILELDPQLAVRASYTCPALAHAHELVYRQGHLLVCSTGFDSLLALDVQAGRFVWGLCIRGRGQDLAVAEFSPDTPPPRGDTIHLNQVALNGDAVTMSGARSPCWLELRDGTLDIVGELPLGTHNVTAVPGGWVGNDTARDRVLRVQGDAVVALSVPRYPVETLERLHGANGPLARQGFARGLVVLDADTVIGGSSPTTLTAWDLAEGVPLVSRRLSLDVRRAVHGITPWPFD